MLRSTLLVTLALAVPASAQAEAPYVTNQAEMVKSGFLLDLTPPASTGAVCIIDTGVNVTKTVAPNVVSLSSSDGASLGSDGDNLQTLHGTHVASILGNNSPLMPGIFPSAIVRSVKADIQQSKRFYDSDILAAVSLCRSYPDVQVVSMSLGGYSEYSPEFATAITETISSGISVVSAAGNDRKQGITTLSQIPGVISVGGIDTEGNRCSSTLDQAVSLVALGCDVEVISPTAPQEGVVFGTSGAAPQVSAALLALRAYNPSLDARAAERIVMHSTDRSYVGGNALDITAAFREANISIYNPMTKPKLKLRYKGRKVIISPTNQPKGTTILITGEGASKQGLNRVVLSTRTYNKAKVRFVSFDGRRKSKAVTVNLDR